MKLFVVGSASGDPLTWSKERDGIALVIAASEHDARSMVEETSDCPVSEVPIDKPIVLASLAGNDVLDAMAD
ncbi:MAG: hypothetical protein EOQ55_00750 [Mesorhizobium sp.]|uniref:hypothetical protein n=1 Tax=unclassified Mesorhizobium TaxID=325217 RepID=UPI000FCB92E6|nr:MULTISPECIES: hypothetical protein [unclassified Mesorhizobium]RUV41078.1 hypothetical protein EOD29_25180 [Mesorhizobium sp. M1A.T.Ca.IN.004.03.1.1]RWG23318.1 MAG: hypothetical protein EOQ55_00750 [Mesorhizobium sp.]RWG60484.1 MAG: hypothetical protein EOQ64_01525 [Mesorhizobium sp.]RWH39483.1 MAG: hypothetical protein EOQ78_22120 [Mesorhizobium sp.]RWK30828.1 MAG: hypothetical protein EOR40_24675 [Mesorhizobium sp.]